MDLTNFIGNVDKEMYKVSFLIDDTKVKRFIRAVSKENARYLIEQDLKKEYPQSKFSIVSVDDVIKVQITII